MNKKNISPSQIYRDLQSLSLEVILLIKAKYKNKIFNLNIEKFLKYYNAVRLYIQGKDLTGFGLKPGPDYKKILNQLLYLQIDGKISSRNAAFNWLKKWSSLS